METVWVIVSALTYPDLGRSMGQNQITQSKYSLAKIGLLVGLPPAALERVQRRCSWRGYQPGEPILGYQNSSDNVFFITEGEARVTIYSLSGKAVSFRELSAGEMFGEFPAIDEGPRSASVEAKTECLVAYMPAAEFRDLLRKEWAVTQALLRKLVMTIRSLTTRVYEFSTLAVNNRIQAELLRLASLASQGGDSARIAPAPTHVEIASRVSSHREAVTRELNRLSRIGLIERRGGTLLVKDLDRLAKMVQDATGE